MISKNRLILAILLLPPLYLLIAFLPPFPFFLLMTAVLLMAQWEFYSFHPPSQPLLLYLGLTLGFLVACHFYRTTPWRFDSLMALGLTALFMFHLFFFRQIQDALLDVAVVVTGVFYPAVFLGHLISIRRMGAMGVIFIFFLLFVIWGGDAGAYYTGRAIGGKKLYPAVSPNKTVSGALGGLVASVIGGMIVKGLFPLFPLAWGETILLALILGGVGQMGDLVESLFKRSAGVKDSSRLVLAHGGLLDKLDGVAFAAPVLYHYLLWRS